MLKTLLALLLVVTPPTSPAPDAQLQENLIKYQAIAEDLAVTVKQIGVIKRQIDGLREQMKQRRAAVGRVAAASYRNYRADSLTVIVHARDSNELRERLLMANVFAQQREHEIRELSLAAERYAAAQRTLDSLVAQQKSQQEELLAQRHLIEAQLLAGSNMAGASAPAADRQESSEQ